MIDLDCSEHIAQFVDAFYDALLSSSIAHVFTDVAKVDLSKHKPLIVSYWEKLLLNSKEYQRHTMNIHRHIYEQYAFSNADFETWLRVFNEVLDAGFSGAKTDQARRTAERIIVNMHQSFTHNRASLELYYRKER
ncbi:MAG: group III truncated hemoglobin [Pseudomonadota bacterium]